MHDVCIPKIIGWWLLSLPLGWSEMTFRSFFVGHFGDWDLGTPHCAWMDSWRIPTFPRRRRSLGSVGVAWLLRGGIRRASAALAVDVSGTHSEQQISVDRDNLWATPTMAIAYIILYIHYFTHNTNGINYNRNQRMWWFNQLIHWSSKRLVASPDGSSWPESQESGACGPQGSVGPADAFFATRVSSKPSFWSQRDHLF